jgi:hypothetical protein
MYLKRKIKILFITIPLINIYIVLYWKTSKKLTWIFFPNRSFRYKYFNVQSIMNIVCSNMIQIKIHTTSLSLFFSQNVLILMKPLSAQTSHVVSRWTLPLQYIFWNIFLILLVSINITRFVLLLLKILLDYISQWLPSTEYRCSTYITYKHPKLIHRIISRLLQSVSLRYTPSISSLKN